MTQRIAIVLVGVNLLLFGGLVVIIDKAVEEIKETLKVMAELIINAKGTK